jgi:biopolymer transport protein TolQ
VLRYFRSSYKNFLGDIISGLALLLIAGRLGTLIEQTGWVARVVLGILLILSVFSWAIIFQKSSQFGRIEPQTRKFLQMFRAGRGLPDPNTLRVGAGGTPLVAVYQAGYRELEAQLGGPTARGNPSAGGGKLKNANAVGVEMQVAAGEEVRRLEKWMSWLATTGSVSPFIGLFGTVWGVMDAFAGLGDAGTASLRAVAPGIAEALITTAAGLFAAIPAVIAYNHYLSGIRGLAARMDGFAAEFVAKIETIYSS